MKKLFAIVLVQLFFGLAANAQYQDIDPKYITQVKGKILLVALQEETTRTLIDLKPKPEEFKLYKDGIANFDTMLLQTAKKIWKYGKGVQGMPQKEVDKLMKEGNSKYVVFQYALREGRPDPLMFKDIYGNNEYGNAERQLAKEKGYSVFHLQVAQKDKEPIIVYSVHMPVAYPSEGDVTYALQMMNSQFMTRSKKRDYLVEDFKNEIAANNKTLKKRTLLLDPTQITTKTTVEELKKSYGGGNIEIADYAFINNVIKEGNGDYAYVMITPIEMPNHKVAQNKVSVFLMHLVLDAEDGKVLARAKPVRMNYDKIADDVTRKEIKEYILD